MHKGALLKSLLEAPPQAVGGGGGGSGGGGGAAVEPSVEPSVEPLAEERCGMGAAEWCEMQAEVLDLVERGTYAHKVLRYKYQDVAESHSLFVLRRLLFVLALSIPFTRPRPRPLRPGRRGAR